jgi:glycosyltransferase involved in cell wall biosynthesis
MNILIIHQNFVDHEHPGGTRHFELASALIRDGHQVKIVAGSLNYLTGERLGPQTGWVNEENLQGVRILRAYAYPSLHRSFAWRAFSFLTFMFTSVWASLRAGPIDVVMGTSPPIFQLFSAWIVSVIRWRPLVIEIRDLWPEFPIAMGILKNRLIIFGARWSENFLYARAHHLIVNSPAFEDYLIAKGVNKDKITLIPNGVDPEMFDPDSTGAEFRRKLGLNGNFIVTYAGALGQANDIVTILRAAERLKEEREIHFLLVGDGKEKDNLVKTAERMQLENVTFAGCYPKTQMADVLAASNVCLATLQDIPMFRTTYPNKVFDYMAAGRPTVLGIDGVIRQVIENAAGGRFVPPGDGSAMADAILELKRDPDLRRRMGRSARSYVEKHFHRRSQAHRLEELLIRLAERREAAIS